MIQNLCIELMGENTTWNTLDKVALANGFLKTNKFNGRVFQQSFKVEKKIGFEKVQLQLVMNAYSNTSINILFYVFNDFSLNTLDKVKEITNNHKLILVRTYSEKFKDPVRPLKEIEQYASQNSIPFHHVDLSNEKAIDDFFTQSVENYLKKQNTCYLVFNKEKRTINTEQSHLETLCIQYGNLGNKFLFWQKSSERTTQLNELNIKLTQFFQSKKTAQSNGLTSEEYRELADIIKKTQKTIQRSHEQSIAGRWGFTSSRLERLLDNYVNLLKRAQCLKSTTENHEDELKLT